MFALEKTRDYSVSCRQLVDEWTSQGIFSINDNNFLLLILLSANANDSDTSYEDFLDASDQEEEIPEPELRHYWQGTY